VNVDDDLSRLLILFLLYIAVGIIAAVIVTLHDHAEKRKEAEPQRIEDRDGDTEERASPRRIRPQ
jgi:hypothetical protein